MHLALLACIACIGHVTAAPFPSLECPPLTVSSTVESVTCLKEQHIVSCRRPMTAGTVAVVKCNKVRHNSSLESSMAAVCSGNGTWMYSAASCKIPAPTVLCPPITTDPAVQSVTCLKHLSIVNCSEAMAEGTLAVSVCSKYHSAGKSKAKAAVCNSQGNWTNIDISCQVPASTFRCPPITTSPAVQSVTCLHHLSIVDCSTDMADGTLAVFVCNKYHYAGKLTSTTAICNRNGTWTYSSTACQIPDCGRQHSGSMEIVEEKVQDGEMPWNVNIHEIKSRDRQFEEWIYRCAGTLISPKHVITSAKCVSDKENVVFPAQNVLLAAHKLLYDAKTSNPDMQWSLVASIIRYQPHVAISDVVHNIALLVARSSYTLGENVMPACIDWTGDLPEATASDELIAAGYKLGTSNTSVKLVASRRYSIVHDRAICRDSAESSRRQYVTDGQFCARTVDNHTCMASPGSGLALGYKTSDGVRHFLRGVESAWLDHKLTDACATDILVAFSNLTQYLPWIREHF